MFGPKPSLFPRVLHQHFPTHFEYFKKNFLRHSTFIIALISAFCLLLSALFPTPHSALPIPHSPFPTPHSPLPTSP